MSPKSQQPSDYEDDKTIKRPPNSSLSIFRRMVNDFERDKSAYLNIADVSTQFNIQNRRVYDFFNVLSALNICKGYGRGWIVWKGIKYANPSIVDHYYKIEVASLNQPMSTLFDLGESPSLGCIASNILSLFVFLKVKYLNIHEISAILKGPRSDHRSLERRLYLVLSLLESLNMFTHLKRSSEYWIQLDTNKIADEGLALKKMYCIKNKIMTYDVFLSRLDESYKNSLFLTRQKEFNKLITGK